MKRLTGDRNDVISKLPMVSEALASADAAKIDVSARRLVVTIEGDILSILLAAQRPKDAPAQKTELEHQDD